MSFARRRIDVTITLGSGTFGENAGDTVTLSGHRIVAQIVTIGGGEQPTANLQIYGLPLATINKLTTIGATMTAIRIKNSISISAGDAGSALSTIYEGVIDQAWGDFQSAPDVCLNVSAMAALDAAMKPIGANSFPGTADVATIMEILAKKGAGYGFENHGVKVTLSNPYFPGTALEQIKSCARAANINWVVINRTLIIWPKDGAVSDPVQVISPETGMVGYPAFCSNGIAVTTTFRPQTRPGSQIDVRSSLPVASGMWNVYAFQHSLESERPGGAWFTHINGFRPDGKQ